MAEQARCKKCNIRYIFADKTIKKIPLKAKKVVCPHCKSILTATLYFCKAKVEKLWSNGKHECVKEACKNA